MQQTSDQLIIEAAETLERELAAPRFQVTGLDPAELCAKFRSIKPAFETLLPALGFIPVYGPPIAAGVKVLMSIATQLCPATQKADQPTETP
jgi:hypothetical protein